MNINFASEFFAPPERKVLINCQKRVLVCCFPCYDHKNELRIIAVRKFREKEKGKRYALHHCNVKKIVKTLIAWQALLKLSMSEIMKVKQALIEAKQKDDYQTILLS